MTNSTDWQERFIKLCVEDWNGEIRKFIQQEIDASYKRGVEETLKRAIESLPDVTNNAKNCFSGAGMGYYDGFDEAIQQSRTNLEQLNQTHREVQNDTTR
jgi:hypothetical protein